MEEREVLEKVLSTDFLLWAMAGTIAIIAIVTSAISSIVRTVARERTRREIAAYIAEGSMTPEQGERLMTAGRSKKEC